MSAYREGRKGNAMVEFTLVGIPMIFILISVFEMARGMWVYHTLAYAVKEGTRYAIVHGENCTIDPNDCEITVADVVERVRQAGTGLIPDELNLTLRSVAGDVVCNPITACLGDTSIWPPGGGANSVGQQLSIIGTYPFRSALAMFWPGSRPVAFGVVNFPASSTEEIQF